MRNISLLGLVIFGLLFNSLFYKTDNGINLSIFNFLCVSIAFYLHPTVLKYFWSKWLTLAILIYAIVFVFHNNYWSQFVNFILLFLWAGSLSYEKARSFLYVIYQSINNIGGVFIPSNSSKIETKKNTANGSPRKMAKWNWRRLFQRVSIYSVPALIVVFFIYLYRKSNQVFDNLLHKLFDRFQFILDWIQDIIPEISIAWISMFLLAVLVGRYLFQGAKFYLHVANEHLKELTMRRTRTQKVANPGLKLTHEYKAAVFLFAALNLILLLVNLIDLDTVWFGFEWNNEVLKEYVHQGTWTLILSIILGAIIVLYFFRNNLNFYKNNFLLKTLTQIWIYFNAFLTLSVLMRNYRYIYHYGFAYKRLAVVFVLLGILFFLLFISYKVYKKHTIYQLFRNTSLVSFVLFLISGILDWSTIIVKYNLAHSNHNFVHLEFLATFPDRCLPYLDLSKEQLDELIQKQKNFNLSTRVGNQDFYELIQNRKQAFLNEYPNHKWQAYTLMNQNAYKSLSKQ